MAGSSSNVSGNGEAQPSGSSCLTKILATLGICLLGTFAGMALRENMTETVYPEPGASKYFYIQDYSGVFSEAAEKYIFDEAVKLNRDTTAQIVVMAVPNTSTEPLESYSLKTANRLGIGSKEKNNGILILFTTDEPHVRMEVGKGLEGAIPDAMAGRILDDYAVADKNSRHWNRAAMNTFTATAEIVYRESGKEVPASLRQVKEVPEGQEGHTFGDMKLPEARPLTADEDLGTRVSNGFFSFLGLSIMLIPFYLAYRFFKSLFSGGGGSGYTGSGGSYSRSRSYGRSSGSHRSSSSGSSHRGGGGGFRGGGASR
ncbi:MAG: TPM domain-containing protein [Succinimonas sp.]|nr:TPM domain-containing protein [Succinimonas sp.]